jgi:hypothetical protein
MTGTVKNMMARGVLVLALGILPATVALAAPPLPDQRAFKDHPALSDSTLGIERGAYISADQILYFGVEMYTEWHDGNGQLVALSQLNIGIDRSGGTPTVNVTNNVQTPNVNNGSATSSGSQPTSGGLNQVQGVTQVVQTTGNHNGVTNSIGIDVGTQPSPVAGLPNPGGSNSASNQGTGVTAQTYVTPTGAGVLVTVPTQGTASQSVASMIGMQQQAQIFGDANIVHNQLNMMIQVQPNTTISAPQMNNVLQTLPGM